MEDTACTRDRRHNKRRELNFFSLYDSEKIENVFRLIKPVIPSSSSTTVMNFEASTSNTSNNQFDLFNVGSRTPPKPKPARQRILRPTQPASLDSGYRYRNRQNSAGNLKSDGDQYSLGGNRRRAANLHHSSSPMSATGSKFSHAILSSSPLAPNDAADPKKRLWKERFKSQQLRKISRARDVDSARISSKQLFNLAEEPDEDDDFLQHRVGNLLVACLSNSILRSTTK